MDRRSTALDRKKSGMSRIAELLERLVARIGKAEPPVIAGCGWLAVYVLLVLTGQTFDTRYLNFGWQLVPWDVLSANPWSSVWYLHIQPPLWNLTLGVAAWASPFSDGLTLQFLMAGFGCLAAGCAALLGQRLGLSRGASIAVALVATLHPETLKGAFEPTYELPVAALLLAVLSSMAPGNDNESSRHASRRIVVLAVLVTAVTMTRSLYHPVWALLLLGIALFFSRQRLTRRQIVGVLAIPIVVIGGWTAKNQVMFGQANLSSWFGMNLQRAVIPVLDLEDLQEMRARQQVSEIAIIGPFGNYALYEDAVDPCQPRRSHRALSEPIRTTDQWSPNFNFECFLPIFEQAGRDAWAVIREHPDAWLEGRLWSLRSTASVAVTPAESPSSLMRGLDQIYSWVRLDYGGVLSTRGWGTPIYGQLTAPVDFGLVLVPVYLVVALVGIAPIVRRVLGRPMSGNGLVLVAGSITVAFTVLVGAVAELGEQARFRTMTDPIALVIVAAVAASVIRRRRSRSADTQSHPGG